MLGNYVNEKRIRLKCAPSHRLGIEEFLLRTEMSMMMMMMMPIASSNLLLTVLDENFSAMLDVSTVKSLIVMSTTSVITQQNYANALQIWAPPYR